MQKIAAEIIVGSCVIAFLCYVVGFESFLLMMAAAAVLGGFWGANARPQVALGRYLLAAVLGITLGLFCLGGILYAGFEWGWMLIFAVNLVTYSLCMLMATFLVGFTSYATARVIGRYVDRPEKPSTISGENDPVSIDAEFEVKK